MGPDLRHPEVYQGEDGEWRWRQRAGNGEIVAQGEGYTSRSTCIDMAERVTGRPATMQDPAGP